MAGSRERRVRAALVTPLTGPLGGYGRAGAEALRLWAEGSIPAARPGPDPPTTDLLVYDAYPDPIAAVRRAEAGRPHLVFGPYGSGPARAVAAATRRLLVNHGGARAGGGGPRVDILAPAESYLVGALRVLTAAAPDLRSVAIVHGDSGFARAVAHGAEAEARRLGLSVATAVLPPEGAPPPGLPPPGPLPPGPLPPGPLPPGPPPPGPPPPGGPVPPAEVLLVAGTFEQELTLARAVLPGAWRAAVFVGAGVEEVLADIGAAREGLLGPAQWVEGAAPERPDEGPPAAAFVAAYRARTGEEPAYPAVQAYAAGVIAARCLRDAGGVRAIEAANDPDVAILAAARALDCTTLFGRFRLDPLTGAQIGHEVVTVQWQDGRRRVVWPAGPATVPVRMR